MLTTQKGIKAWIKMFDDPDSLTVPQVITQSKTYILALLKSAILQGLTNTLK